MLVKFVKCYVPEKYVLSYVLSIYVRNNYLSQLKGPV